MNVVEQMQTRLRDVTKHDVALEGDTTIYVNFGYHEAVVAELHDGVWYACATAWDRTGGVSDEAEITAHPDIDVFARRVGEWLAEQDRYADELSAALGDDE